MFNFWNIFLFILSFSTLILLFFFKTPTVCFYLSEINWILLITNSIIFSVNNGDPRFLIISFFFIFLASIEIVLYIINYTYKTNV